MGIEIVWSSIERQAREQGHVQLLLRAKGDPQWLAETLWRTAEQVLVPSEQDTIGNGGYTVAAGPVVMVDAELVTRAEARQWYTDLAARLEALDISGKLTTLPRTPPPAWVHAEPRDPRPSGHLLYTRDPDTRRLPPDTRHRLATAASTWLHTPHGHGYLTTAFGPSFLVDPAEDLTDVIDPMLAQRDWCSISVEPPTSAWLKRIALDNKGPTGLRISDAALTWNELVTELRDTLLWHPELLDYGFIRSITSPWSLFRGHDYPMPYDNDLAQPFVWERGYSGLDDRLAYNNIVVPDAHGIQLLTGAHLAKAHDLTNWTITPVAPDRYLVEAPDLAPWYAQPFPDQATLDHARADFGDMIITDTNIDLYPRLREPLN